MVVSRRSLLTGSLGLALAGCEFSPTVLNAYDVAKAQIFGHPDLPLQRKTIAKLPYATMTARVGKGPQALLLLGRVQGGEEHWISGVDRSVLTLMGGRVIKTFGFPENLKNTRSNKADPVDRRLHQLRAPLHHTRYVDLDLGAHFGLRIDSIFELVGERRLRIVELDFETILVREKNSARGLQWEFENLYWVDPGDGYVWKSRQTIARTFPPVEFEILKPPG
ncbi:MAG: YjbF family lipoprotein [Alphaproteobacteria bacterium]|nr:YjbF family lipoprotein [Alphaproteobacteria bacterium]MDP6814719.1 YjbF family lipoprotein [Alphaproteobacteria bacterium]